MKTILSPNNDYIRKLLKLHEKKYRDQEREFLVEGYHLVREAKAAKVLKQVLIVDERDCLVGVENILVSESVIKKLAFTVSPQPIIGICDYFPDYDLKGKRILLLDDLQDPGNLGTIVRSSLGFGVDLLVLGINSVDIYNDKFIRATQGAIFKTKIIKKDLLEAIKTLRKDKIPVLGTSLNGKPLREIPRMESYALVLGNEGRGIAPQILKETDFNVTIEIRPELESLNVAVAAGIIIYHLDKNK